MITPKPGGARIPDITRKFKMKKTIIVDIETGPLPQEQILYLIPEFKPEDVKTGNLKDPAKIEEKIAAACAAHRESFIRDAALDALTCKIVAIGMKPLNEEPAFLVGQEFPEGEIAILTQFNEMIRVDSTPATIVTFNGNTFDLSVIFRRCLIHNIQPPRHLRSGRYWSAFSCDLREEWQLGDKKTKGSLDSICQAMGIGRKSGNGKDFAALLKTDPYAAIAYLRNDLVLTEALYKRLVPQY